MMSRLIIEEIQIEKVRHLRDIVIPASSNDLEIKHIIFTGKNGSGKTSLLDAMAGYIGSICKGETSSKLEKLIEQDQKTLTWAEENGDSRSASNARRRLKSYESRLGQAKNGIALRFNIDEGTIREQYEQGECVFAYFKAQRAFMADEPKSIEKVELKSYYGINESPRSLFLKYMLDLKMTQALAASNGKREKADGIQRWFDEIRDILRDIYEDPSLTIEFDEDSYQFLICERGREPFNFNSASDGFSAVVDIVADLMLRMQVGGRGSLNRNLPGIVLLDEIENHLHLSLQKRIFPYLEQLFPNVQFVISTHSPFVLSSVANAIVFDLESLTIVENGLSVNTYDSIVEGYFNVDGLSRDLREKYDRYKSLAKKDALTRNEFIEVVELETYLDEIPDYLALDIATEYKRIRLQMRSKGVCE